jgi:hypothetical protein
LNGGGTPTIESIDMGQDQSLFVPVSGNTNPLMLPIWDSLPAHAREVLAITARLFGLPMPTHSSGNL